MLINYANRSVFYPENKILIIVIYSLEKKICWFEKWPLKFGYQPGRVRVPGEIFLFHLRHRDHIKLWFYTFRRMWRILAEARTAAAEALICCFARCSTGWSRAGIARFWSILRLSMVRTSRTPAAAKSRHLLWSIVQFVGGTFRAYFRHSSSQIRFVFYCYAYVSP